MIIRRSEVMGFCSGVNRAVELLEKAIARGEQEGLPVYSIGLLIHNQRFLDHMGERGVSIIRKPEEAPPGIAVIRAHGMDPELRESFRKAGFQLVDGTCGRVKRSQQMVEKYSKQGWAIVIAGDEGHGEVKSILGHVMHEEAYVIKDLQEIQKLAIGEDGQREHQPVFLIAQTTFSPYIYAEIQNAMQKSCEDAGCSFETIDTICSATMMRQEALKKLCDSVDAVVVIGGKASANTRRLYERALSCGKAAWHISGAGEIPEEVFKYSRVGVTAGASTPAWIIDEVTNRLAGLEGLEGLEG